MKYTVEIDIDLPVEKVVELFDNPDNLKKWMKGLQSFEHLSGEPGKPGAQSKLKFKMGNREMEMVETITKRDLPREFSGTYDVKGVHNIVKNFFVPLGPNKTKYKTEQEFQFNGIMMKLFGFLMPGMFKKQSMQYLKDFKEFAEKEASQKK